MKKIDPTIPAEDQEKTQEETPEKTSKLNRHVHHWHRFRGWYIGHKRLAIPLTVLVVLFLLVGIPLTRFKVAGLVLKKNFTIQVTDATAHIPVSGATVTAGSVSAVTDGAGKATLKDIKVGSHSFNIAKKYYSASSVSEVVPILKQKNDPTVSLSATGRQAKIHVTNLINQKVLADVDIQMADVKTKTDSKGNALVVLPANAESQKATLSLDGYNNTTGDVAASNSSIKETDFKLTPTGKVYFLSKLSGTIDVVKTNLDGTQRQTVVAGTGQEDDYNTVLLASQDWQYLALYSNRSGSPSLYVINTQDDKLLDMDEGDADFAAIGWYDHYFIYTVSRHGYNLWQPGQFSIKSYNAETGKIISLADSGASGTDLYSAYYESLGNIQIVGDNVVFTRTLQTYRGLARASGAYNTLSIIHPDGTGAKDPEALDTTHDQYISQTRLVKPRQLDFSISDGNETGYYILDKNGNASQSSDVNQQVLDAPLQTYLLSPSGNQTFWQDARDGKNTLFVGDQDAGGAKQIATLSDYSVYGWYTDNYLLVSKNASELYVIPASGIKSDAQAIKITDYHKPAQSFFGYGGGYGGL